MIDDHLGTPQQIVNTSGEVVWKAAYLPFGQAQVLVETIECNIRFKGQYFDAETGLHYNVNRYYNPLTGRYLTPDPIGLDGGINLWAYASNSPLNYIDPFGLYQSSPWLSWVPGQHFFDLGMTAIENNQYGSAAAYFSGMIAEQALFALTLKGGGGSATGTCSRASKNVPKIKGTQEGLRNPSLGLTQK